MMPLIYGLILGIAAVSCVIALRSKKATRRLDDKQAGTWGHPIQLELWGRSNPGDAATKITTIEDDAVYSIERLPPAIQFRMSSNADHNTVLFYVFSNSGRKHGWGPSKQLPPRDLYTVPTDGEFILPTPGPYKAKCELRQDTKSVGIRRTYFTIR